MDVATPRAGGIALGFVAGPERGAERRGLLSDRLAGAIRTLHPSSFAMVMATGIVAIAAWLGGMKPFGRTLTWLNVLAFAVLWALTLLRAGLYRRDLMNDLASHARGVGFFTTVAASAVLGSQLFLIAHAPRAALGLWLFSVVLGACLIYAIFASLTVADRKATLAEGIDGGWLVSVVATESVSSLGTMLLPVFEGHRAIVLFFSLSLWLSGGMLYIWMISWMISLILYRYTSFRFSPSDLMPPYWINMGAVAVSTLAGTMLIKVADQEPFLDDILPFLKGFTLFFWATATGWIPMLVILGIWRHVIRRYPIAYDPLYWGAVFPLGMYTVCTRGLAEAMLLPFLLWIPRVMIYAAIAAWIVVFSGLVRSLAFTVVGGRPDASRPTPGQGPRGAGQ